MYQISLNLIGIESTDVLTFSLRLLLKFSYVKMKSLLQRKHDKLIKSKKDAFTQHTIQNDILHY